MFWSTYLFLGNCDIIGCILFLFSWINELNLKWVILNTQGDELDDCEDVSGKRWLEGDKYYTCKELVDKDPCNCRQYQQECCHSCKTASKICSHWLSLLVWCISISVWINNGLRFNINTKRDNFIFISM